MSEESSIDPNALHSTQPFPNPSPTEQLMYQTAYIAARALVDGAAKKTENDKLQQYNLELVDQAKHDQLTGLLNREGWMENVYEAMKENRPFGVMFLDLDNFKLVNDTLGHKHGDVVLKDFARLLERTLRDPDDESGSDSIAHERRYERNEAGRFGGDEFKARIDLAPRVKLRPGHIRRAASNIDRMRTVTNHIYTAVHKFNTSHPDLEDLGFGVSIGWDIWRPGQKIENTLHAADMAMLAVKDAKGAGR